MNRGKITRLAFIIVFLCFFMSTFVSLWSRRMLGRQNMEELSKALASRIYDSISSQLPEPCLMTVFCGICFAVRTGMGTRKRPAR